MDVHNLPLLNASLNGLAGILLIGGWLAIRNKRPGIHKTFMLAALTVSILFLVSYLTYHFSVPGVTRYQKQGLLRIIYFTILLTHTPLAAIAAPASLVAVYHALKRNYTQHVKITKWLLPMWLYVSVTGVLIYLMLYVF